MSKGMNVSPIRIAARLWLVALGIALSSSLAQAQDAEGCKDNLLLGRFQGSTIAYCKVKDFDELVFLHAPHDYGALLDRNATKDRSGPEWLRLQGKASEIRYELAPGTSSLEAQANYQAVLKDKGFATVFSCADQECLTGNLRDPYLLGEQLDPANGVSTAYSDHARYILAKLDRPEGVVYVSVMSGEDKDKTVAFLRILEARGMEPSKIATPTDSPDLSASLETQGSVNLYGILFDYDQDAVKPESKPALDAIAKVLADKPTLRLKIIGHTDNTGSAAYNQDLSSRRAANVSAALVGGYGIDPARLSFEGAGMSRPIESNDTDEGRAKNRRVELVVQ
jgi:outer membrane protein OmpA-like peptidoglycan-associated protein